jgi:hypothetical protein
MHTDAPDIERTLERIQSEYREMPGLRLTPWQAQRLFGLDLHRCDCVMGALVAKGFLAKTRAGAYVRAGMAA